MKVYRSNRTERLLDALAGLLEEPSGQPLVPEWIAVPSRGLEAWLDFQLAARLGIWANAWYPFPRLLIRRILTAGHPGPLPEPDPYEADNLVWTIMAVLPGLLERPDFTPLAAYLDGTGPARGLPGLARQIALCFDRYLIYRPELILRWPEEYAPGWQKPLWEAIEARLGPFHLPALTGEFFRRLEENQPVAGDLPGRIILFGTSTLPPMYISILDAVSRVVPVHFFQLSPSAEYWASLRSRRELIRQRLRVSPDWTGGELHYEEGHPLLGSWGKLGREFQLILEDLSDYTEPVESLFEDPLSAGGSPAMLARLQSAIMHLHPAPSVESMPSPAGFDASVQIHSCHSPLREVEALREVLLGCFEEDPDLQPHEVAVMMPSVEIYAPAIQAVFGESGPDAAALPFRLCDRPASRLSPANHAFLALLDLANGRCGLDSVCDFLELPPVRERLGFTLDELAISRQWLEQAGVRWGRDENHRRQNEQPATRTFTWRSGLERLFLGYALPGRNERQFAGVTPHDGAEGLSAGLLGRLAGALDTLFGLLQQLDSPRPAGEWSVLLDRGLAQFSGDTGTIRETLDRFSRLAEQAGCHEPFTLAGFRQLIESAMDELVAPGGFSSGCLTFCNLVPMRCIPYRVICLLGIQDGEFPRQQITPSFDLTAARPRPGDRRSRDDDRYLFLEALLSSRSRFIVFYRGQDPQSNREIPPSPLVEELATAMAELVPAGRASGETSATRESLLQQLVVKHPLHGFSPACFSAENGSRLFSFSRQACQGARILLAPRQPVPPMLTAAAPAGQANHDQVFYLEELIKFYKNPGGYFQERILGLHPAAGRRPPVSREPFLLEGLDRYRARSLMVETTRQTGIPPDQGLLASAAGLPAGTPGRLEYESLLEQTAPLAAWLREKQTPQGPEDPLDVDLILPAGRLAGRAGDLFPGFRLVYSLARQLDGFFLEQWIIQLALQESGFGRPGLLAGLRDEKKAALFSFRHPLPDSHAILNRLLELFISGLALPLPFLPGPASCYIAQLKKGAGETQARQRAARAWEEEDRYSPGQMDRMIRLFGYHPVLEDPAGPVPGFARLSLDIMSPLLENLHEDS